MDGEYVIGITGHRRLAAERVSALSASVLALYGESAAKYDAVTVMSSLAEGADSLCARLAIGAGLRLVVPLPVDAAEYRKDFAGSAAAEFDELLSLAAEAFVAPHYEQCPPAPPRGFFYRQAGIHVAKYCDVLLAIWNGVETNTADGAGTWETIKLARVYGKPEVLLLSG